MKLQFGGVTLAMGHGPHLGQERVLQVEARRGESHTPLCVLIGRTTVSDGFPLARRRWLGLDAYTNDIIPYARVAVACLLSMILQ